MLEAVSLSALTARPRYIGAAWLDTHRQWHRQDSVGLQILCSGAISLERAADSLGRSPSAIAHRAHDTGLKLPPEWRDLIRPKRLRETPRSLLQYPYVTSVRGEHADLLQVNALVPKGLPSETRGDVCQELMLAIWEKRISLDELKRDRRFINEVIGLVRRSNFEAGGYALSLDAPMRDGRSWYDVLPA